ncbi:MAG TPA: MFS transporter [Candidatus Binataceae bacterium]|nr:MFS transporter [Candidatus Binataceae bacterium]
MSEATRPASAIDGAEIGESAHGERTVRALFAILCYQGYAFALLGIGAPFIAKSFGLNQSGIARMYAWISLNSIGALVLSRMADRIGRRRIVTWGLIITPLCSIGAALAASAAWFIFFEIVVYSAILATFGSAIVMMAEALPIEKRSKGQGWANLAIAAGGGLCVVLAPALAHWGWSWRWMPAVAGAGIVLAPTMVRWLPESRRWERAAASGAAERSHFYDVFGRRYRRRTLPLIVATLIGEASGAAFSTWVYYHAVTVVGLSPAQGSIILLVGGAVSMAGLVIGVCMAELAGRVRTVMMMGLAGTLGVLAFYWGPPAHFAWPLLWLMVAHAWFSTAGRAVQVAGNAAVTELFPTALRGTIVGWLTLTIAFSAIGAQTAIAILAKPLGGLSNVVGWISLLWIPSSLIWGIFIDETQGLSLEAASNEE